MIIFFHGDDYRIHKGFTRPYSPTAVAEKKAEKPEAA